ncbi:hypothetical protein Btru_028592 [Bulinus truncatus]|nr:hypothetical protein Btru_028592 [Bulinus truncatus]
MDLLKSCLVVLATISLYVAAEKVSVEITAKPENIRLGLSTEFSVQCQVQPGVHDTGLTSVLLLTINRIVNGSPVMLAEVKPSSQASAKHGAENAKVYGALRSYQNYLNVTWKYPGADLAGEYLCEGVGVDASGKHVVFADTTTVTREYATQDEYVASLFELHTELDKSGQLLSEAYAVGNLTEVMLMEAQSRLSRRHPPEDCNAVVTNATGCDDPKLSVGYHVIDIVPKDGLGPVKVLCHVRVQGEGWVVFQKRFDGSVDFYKNFHDYEVGFGTVSPVTEFWLGLENLRRLLVDNGDENGLRVDMTERGTAYNFTRIYPIFRVGPGDGYTLIADGYSDGGKGLTENSGAKFSTYDNDFSQGCPSSIRLAGWWFHEGCGFVNLNGMWGLSQGEASMFWYEIYNHPNHAMQATEMKFRPFPSPVKK